MWTIFFGNVDSLLYVCGMGDNIYSQEEIRLRAVKRTVHNELTNIASHLGVPLSSLIKSNLHLITDKYPDNMKKQPFTPEKA